MEGGLPELIAAKSDCNNDNVDDDDDDDDVDDIGKARTLSNELI
jgi:hypothetical protein